MPTVEESRKQKARKLRESLTEQELKILHRDNPFIKERNEAIRNLRARGAEYEVIGLVTGLRRSTVFNIVLGSSHSMKMPREVDLSGIRRAIKDLWREVCKLVCNTKNCGR